MISYSKRPPIAERQDTFVMDEKFNDFRVAGVFCDGIVSSEDGIYYKVHRVVLAASSDYFQAAFSSLLCQDQAVAKLEYPSAIVDSIIKFCYTQKCCLSDDNVSIILPAADKLGIIGLVNYCCSYLNNKMTIFNAYGIHQFALFYGCNTLADTAWNLILKEFKSFIECSDEFLEMTAGDLEKALKDCNLNIPCESTAFQALSRWINAGMKKRKNWADKLWSCIRFGLIPAKSFRSDVLEAPFIEMIPSAKLWDAMSANTQIGIPPTLLCLPRIPYHVIFAVGGWSAGAVTSCIESYDVRADQWFVTDLCGVILRAYHGLVSIANQIYIIGGFDGLSHFSSVHALNLETKIWSEKACMHYPRCYVSCVVTDTDIYAIGGFNGSTRMRSVERYSIAENQWHMVASMKQCRSDNGAVAERNKIYVAGGYNGREVLNSAEYYDVETNTWHSLPNLNTRRSGLSLASYKGYIYAIGGFNGGQRLNSSERLNVVNPSEWLMDVPPMITSRSNFSCIVLEDKIFVVGGYNQISTVGYCEHFDGEKWRRIGGMNMNRSALSICVCSGLQNAAEYTALGHCCHLEESQHPNTVKGIKWKLKHYTFFHFSSLTYLIDT